MSVALEPVPSMANALATDGQLLVVVGFDMGGAAAWISTDGRTWEHRAMPPTVSGAWDGARRWWSMTAAMDVEAGPNGFVAAGRVKTDAAVWTSPDGLDWYRSDSAALGGPGLQHISAVAAGGPGWVAVGQRERDGAVWVSVNGEHWESVEDADFREAVIDDIAAGKSGLVAVGMLRRFEIHSDAAIWTSSDGTNWDLSVLPGESRLSSIQIDPSGEFLAFGVRQIWRSSDGINWVSIHERGSDWLTQPPPSASAAWWDGRIVVAGRDVAPSLWTSFDNGRKWARHDPDDPAFGGDNASINSVIVFRDVLIAVGMHGGYGLESGAVWIGEKRD